MPYVRNGGVRIHYEVEGSGAPLVMQHGFTDSSATWYDLGYVEPLKQDYKLVLVDARGHGESDKPHDIAAYAMDRRVGDILAVLDNLAIPQTHYFGYSMGGWIGFGMAKYASDRLHGLIIGAADPGPRKREGYPLLQPHIMREGTDAIPPLWDAPLPATLRDRILANDIEAIRASRIDDPGYLDVLPTMRIPCLLLAGEADPDFHATKTAATRIPGAKFASIPGLNHVETLFRSDLVLSHVIAFLQNAVRTG